MDSKKTPTNKIRDERMAREMKVDPRDLDSANQYKWNDQLKNGPIADRTFTDLLIGFAFVAFCTGMVCASLYGWTYGDPAKLLIGWDSDRNGCGYSEVTKGFPYLYWPEMPNSKLMSQIENGNYDDAISLLNFGVCVKQCPSTDSPVECHKTTYQ